MIDKARLETYLHYGTGTTSGCPVCGAITHRGRYAMPTLLYLGQQRRGRSLVSLHRIVCLACRARWTEVWRQRRPRHGRTALAALEDFRLAPAAPGKQ